MSSKENQRSPLTAAHEFSKHRSLVVESGRLAERQSLGRQFADLADELVMSYGVPDAAFPEIIRTPRVMFETPGGGVVVSVVGETVPEGPYNEFVKLRLVTNYGAFREPFLTLEEPIKPSTVEVSFNEKSHQLLDSEFDLPRTKKLRKAVNVLQMLTEYFNSGQESALIHTIEPQEPAA